MMYIYAPSMAILVYASKRWAWEELKIISFNPQIVFFCKRLHISCIQLSQNGSTNLNGIIAHKKYIRNESRKILKQEIIFGHNSNDYWGLFLMKCLKKNGNTVYYNPQIKEHSKISTMGLLKSGKAFKFLRDKLLLFWVTRIKFDVLHFGEYLFFGIDAKKIRALYKENNSEENLKIFQENQKRVRFEYNLHQRKIILVDQGEAFYKYTLELASFLVELNSTTKNLYLKQHPILKTTNEPIITNLPQIPSEIPIELIINESDLVLGIASSSMQNAKNCISLVQLVDMEKKDREKYIKFLNNNNIIFPKSIIEIRNHINRYLENLK